MAAAQEIEQQAPPEQESGRQSESIDSEPVTKAIARQSRAALDADPDLEWWLLQGDSAMGARGTLAGTINVLEMGGPGGGGNLGEDGSYIHPFTDLQLGTGRCVRGDIERHRWISRAWFACSEESRGRLLARHLAPRARFRSDEGFGARDRHVEGSDGKAGQHGALRTGIEAQLGELANVALAEYGRVKPESDLQEHVQAAETEGAKRLAELIEACHEYSGDASKPSATVTGKQAAQGRTIRRARRVAEKAMTEAWVEWFRAKAATDPMRPTRERRAILPAVGNAGASE